MYKYYQLNLFLVLTGKFDQKSNFHPRMAWSRPYRAKYGQNREKTLFSRAESGTTLFLCI